MSRNLAKSTSVVGGMTLMSRIMGFLRDIIFARFFGAGVGMDVFVVAFQIPNFLRRLFGEGAFSQAFVPVLAEYENQRDHQQVQDLVDRVAGTLGLILFGLTAGRRVGGAGADHALRAGFPGGDRQASRWPPRCCG